MKKLLMAATTLLLCANVAMADGDNKKEKSVKIKRDEAQAIALKEVPGTITDADIERRKKVWQWIIDIKPGDGKPKKEVRIDANSGAVLSVKEHDHDDD